MSNLPVYRLKPVNGDGPVKVMHRNHILSLGQEVRLSTESNPKPSCSPRAIRQRRAKEKNNSVPQMSEAIADESQRECSSDSDLESELGTYLEPIFHVPEPEMNEVTSRA